MPAVIIGTLRRPRTVFEHFEGAPPVITGGKDFLRFDEINQMVRNAAPLGHWNLRRADVEVPVDLRRVANENLAAEPFRKMDAELGFAGGGRAENHQKPRKRAHPGNFQ